MQQVYFVLMMVAGILCVWRGGAGLLLCMGVVAYNWLLNTAFVLASGNTDAVFVFLASDVVSLALVLKWADSAALKQLAALYAGQIIMHAVKIVGDGDPYYYWSLLTGLGFAQLSVLIWAALFTKPPRVEADCGAG